MRHNKVDIVLFALLSMVLAACQVQTGSVPPDLQAASDPSAESVTGMVDVPGGRIFYEMYHPDATGIPILMIHGGPGSSSCYFGLLDEFITDRPMIRYDQLDTGRSERPGDRSNWNLPHAVQEVEAVRVALGLSKVHVFGLSWGGTVAAEFALEGDTIGVVSVILAGPLLSTPIWLEDARLLLSELPATLQETIRLHEADGTVTHPDYIAATDSFYARFLYHQQPPAQVPECEGVTGNPEMYNMMWGPSEFSSSGTLLHYDRLDRLHEISLPVLLIGGGYDEARSETLHRFAEEITDAEVVTIPGAGHVAMVDRPRRYAEALNRFMTSVESRK